MTVRIFAGPGLRDRCALPALALGMSLAMTVGALAQGQTEPFAAACAAKEVPSLILIEEHGAAGDVSAERLSNAGMTLYRARSVCNAGRVTEALALYDSVLALGPVASLRRP